MQLFRRWRKAASVAEAGGSGWPRGASACPFITATNCAKVKSTVSSTPLPREQARVKRGEVDPCGLGPWWPPEEAQGGEVPAGAHMDLLQLLHAPVGATDLQGAVLEALEGVLLVALPSLQQLEPLGILLRLGLGHRGIHQGVHQQQGQVGASSRNSITSPSRPWLLRQVW